MKQKDEQVTGMDASSLPATGNFFLQFIVPFIFFIAASFLIYLPVINHFFVSDDFKVLYRVCFEQTIFIKRFFRPLSDLSIYLNYRMGGLNPVVFNSFNILIHGINGSLIYLTCLYFGRHLDKTIKIRFAVISAALFICYPFHNEGVVWMLGRGASMACLFSLLSVISFYAISNRILKYTCVCLSYFVSMAAFESTLFFPVIFIIILIFEKNNRRSIRRWSSLLILILCLHLILRILISGSILGSYGNDFFHPGIKSIISNMAKVGGRLVLPPAKNALLLSSLFIMLLAFTGLYIFKRLRKIRQARIGSLLAVLILMLILACIVPVITGVSTQTSETDRMLYFPSVFLCMMTGLLLARIKNVWYLWLLFMMVVSYNLYFLELNNMNWKKASAITRSIVSRIQEPGPGEKQEGKVFFLNIPNEISGAYVFRLGFRDALRLYGQDSGRFIAVNYLPRQDLEKIKGNTIPVQVDGEIHLPPDIILKPDSTACTQIYDHGILTYRVHAADQIYFCNPYQLDFIQPCKVPGQE